MGNLLAPPPAVKALLQEPDLRKYPGQATSTIIDERWEHGMPKQMRLTATMPMPGDAPAEFDGVPMAEITSTRFIDKYGNIVYELPTSGYELFEQAQDGVIGIYYETIPEQGAPRRERLLVKQYPIRELHVQNQHNWISESDKHHRQITQGKLTFTINDNQRSEQELSLSAFGLPERIQTADIVSDPESGYMVIPRNIYLLGYMHDGALLDFSDKYTYEWNKHNDGYLPHLVERQLYRYDSEVGLTTCTYKPDTIRECMVLENVENAMFGQLLVHGKNEKHALTDDFSLSLLALIFSYSDFAGAAISPSCEVDSVSLSLPYPDSPNFTVSKMKSTGNDFTDIVNATAVLEFIQQHRPLFDDLLEKGYPLTPIARKVFVANKLR